MDLSHHVMVMADECQYLGESGSVEHRNRLPYIPGNRTDVARISGWRKFYDPQTVKWEGHANEI